MEGNSADHRRNSTKKDTKKIHELRRWLYIRGLNVSFYLTTKGRLIQLEVFKFLDDVYLRHQLVDVDNQPEWVEVCMDRVYVEHRQWDNRMRSDISVDAVGNEVLTILRQLLLSLAIKRLKESPYLSLLGSTFLPMQRKAGKKCGKIFAAL